MDGLEIRPTLGVCRQRHKKGLASAMTKSRGSPRKTGKSVRMPATKFAHLQKKRKKLAAKAKRNK